MFTKTQSVVSFEEKKQLHNTEERPHGVEEEQWMEWETLLVGIMLEEGYNIFIERIGLKFRSMTVTLPQALWLTMVDDLVRYADCKGVEKQMLQVRYNFVPTHLYARAVMMAHVLVPVWKN